MFEKLEGTRIIQVVRSSSEPSEIEKLIVITDAGVNHSITFHGAGEGVELRFDGEEQGNSRLKEEKLCQILNTRNGTLPPEGYLEGNMGNHLPKHDW